MSNIEVYKVITESQKIDNDDAPKAIMEVGPLLTNYKVQNADSESQSAFSFLIQSANGTSTLARELLMETSFEVKMAGVDQGSVLYQSGTNDAPRPWAVQSAMQTLTQQINNSTVCQMTPCDVVKALNHYMPKSMYSKYGSVSPIMQDQYQDLQDYATLGANRNPLALYGTNPDLPTRGSYTVQVVSNTNTSAVLRLTITEPLLLGSTVWDGETLNDYTNIQSMRIEGTWVQNLNAIWSSAVGGSSGGLNKTITVEILGKPKLLYVVHEVNPAYTKIDPFRGYVYNSPFLRVNQEEVVGTLASGATQVVQVNQLKPSNIPSKLLIYACKKSSTRTPNDADSFLAIDTLSVQKGNDLLLSGITPSQLYHHSLQNGLNVSFPEFTRFKGSVVMLDLMKIGNRQGYVAGEAVQEQLSISVTLRNSASTSRSNMVLYIVEIHDSFVTITEQTATQKIGITKDDADRARDAPVSLAVEIEEAVKGGSWKSFWRGVKRVGRTVAKGFRGARKVLDTADRVASAVGLGYGNPRGGARLVGGSYDVSGGCQDCECGSVGKVANADLRRVKF